MPYLPPNLQKRQQQQAAAPTLGGGAPATAAGPSVSAPAAAPVNTGSGWTNLQDYLTANQAPLQAEAQRVGQEFTPKAQQAVAAHMDPKDYGMGQGPTQWTDSTGKVVINPGVLEQETSSPLWTDEQRQQAKDLQFEMKTKPSQPGIDQWLRNASGVQGAWDEAAGKYGDALNTVSGYQWKQPTPRPDPVPGAPASDPSREPVGGPGTPDPTTGEVPPPLGGPLSNLPSVGNPEGQGGYNSGVDLGKGPASQGTPGGMFSFPEPPPPAAPPPPVAPAAPPPKRKDNPDPRPKVNPSTLGEGRRNLVSWLGGR